MSKTTYNIAIINAAIDKAFKANEQMGDASRTLREQFKGVPREEAQNVITPHVGKKYGIGVKMDGQRGATFDREHPSYEAARKFRQNLIRATYGSATSAHKEPAVKRFDRNRVTVLQNALAGLTKAQARAYCEAAIKAAFAE